MLPDFRTLRPLSVLHPVADPPLFVPVDVLFETPGPASAFSASLLQAFVSRPPRLLFSVGLASLAGCQSLRAARTIELLGPLFARP